MHIAEVVTIAKSLPLLRLNTYKSLILSYSADYRRIFEEKLGLDMRTILKDLSRNYLMFIQWEGVVKDDRLCFLTSDSSNFIDLSEISHLTI